MWYTELNPSPVPNRGVNSPLPNRGVDSPLPNRGVDSALPPSPLGVATGLPSGDPVTPTTTLPKPPLPTRPSLSSPPSLLLPHPEVKEVGGGERGEAPNPMVVMGIS